MPVWIPAFEYSLEMYRTTAATPLGRFADLSDSCFFPDGTVGGVIRQFSETFAGVYFDALEYMSKCFCFGRSLIRAVLGSEEHIRA
jgi:hypothetical protein